MLANRPEFPSRSIDLIVIHCTATPNGKPLQRGMPGAPGYQNCAQIIDDWHAERGFRRDPQARAQFNYGLRSIGYHFCIDLNGQVYTGRNVSEIGAHAKDFNAHSLGICMVGGLEREGQFTSAQWKSLAEVVLWLSKTYAIQLTMPPRRNGNLLSGGVCGHRDVSPDADHNGAVSPNEWLKTCPGFDVRAWIARGLQPLKTQVCEISQTSKTTNNPNRSPT
jgi:N-acetyl-anhydromuramyl-L-alanine amidase AmpD